MDPVRRCLEIPLRLIPAARATQTGPPRAGYLAADQLVEQMELLSRRLLCRTDAKLMESLLALLASLAFLASLCSQQLQITFGGALLVFGPILEGFRQIVSVTFVPRRDPRVDLGNNLLTSLECAPRTV